MHADSTFEIKSWDEKPYQENADGGKLTRATVKLAFEGDITGEGWIEYVMAYPDAVSATFVGIQYMNGTLGGRTGTYAIQVTGTYSAGGASSDWFVVPGSATGELKGLRGKGGGTAGAETRLPFALDYDFEE